MGPRYRRRSRRETAPSSRSTSGGRRGRAGGVGCAREARLARLIHRRDRYGGLRAGGDAGRPSSDASGRSTGGYPCPHEDEDVGRPRRPSSVRKRGAIGSARAPRSTGLEESARNDVHQLAVTARRHRVRPERDERVFSVAIPRCSCGDVAVAGGPALQTLPILFSRRPHLALTMTCRRPRRRELDRAATAIRPRRFGARCHAIDRTQPNKAVATGAPDARCSSCHPAWNAVGTPPRVVIPTPNLKFNHQVHASRGVPCARCHGDLTQVDLATRAQLPLMATCLECHDGRTAAGTAPLHRRSGRALADTSKRGGQSVWRHRGDAHDLASARARARRQPTPSPARVPHPRTAHLHAGGRSRSTSTPAITWRATPVMRGATRPIAGAVIACRRSASGATAAAGSATTRAPPRSPAAPRRRTRVASTPTVRGPR